jgi:hypothetical protein
VQDEASATAADLPPAPPRPVSAGEPLLGAYAGACELVRWDGLAGRWARGPLWRFAHLKRWHYVSIAGPRVIAAFAIVDVGYVANAFAYLFDREAHKLRADLGLLGPPRIAAEVSERPGAGARSTFARAGAVLRIERRGDFWEIFARAPGGLLVEAQLDAAAAPPTLCAIQEIEGGLANCTHKTSCLPARGVAEAGGARFDLAGHAGALDHTVGLLARETRWRWASAQSHELGFNLSSGFMGGLENVVWHRGRLHPVGAADIVFDAATSDGAWRVRTQDGAIDLTFRPEGERRQDQDLVLASSRYVQPFGSFHGSVRVDGRALPVRDLPGVTEDHVARW